MDIIDRIDEALDEGIMIDTTKDKYKGIKYTGPAGASKLKSKYGTEDLYDDILYYVKQFSEDSTSKSQIEREVKKKIQKLHPEMEDYEFRQKFDYAWKATS